MKRRIALLALFVTVALSGCQNAKNVVIEKPMTVAEVDAKIKAVESDPGMPAPAKQSVLATLQRDREIAAKRQTGVR